MELASDFPAVTRADWRALALAVLRGAGEEVADPEDLLATPGDDGPTVAPLYDAADLRGATGRRPTGRGWDVRQRHAVADPEAVLADLENGVTSLWLALPPDDLPGVLKEVRLGLAPVVLQAGERAVEAAEVLFELAAARAAPLSGSLGLAATSPEAAALARRCLDGHPELRAVVVDATPYHDAGAGEATELGCSLALGAAALRVLTSGGLSVAEAFAQLEFRYAATAEQFATMAKLRAARRLWARVAELSGGPSRQLQHAVTSSAMMTRRDPWVNMLRTTLACFGAGVGGADAVTVQPFDAAAGPPDGFSRRIARNTQLLLQREASLGRVADAAGGSWYVERYTHELAVQAWEWFREIERAGGIEAAAPLVEARIAEVRARREAEVADRRRPITGVSDFPDLAERSLRPAEPPAAEPSDAEPPATGLAGDGPVLRYAAPFEELRDRADAQPERPAVFLATLGPAAAYTARAAFAANLFAAGGVRALSSGPLLDAGELAAAFAASGCAVACLCSSDQLYGEHAEAVAVALRAAGARRVWLAGRGGYPGVDGVLHAGCDALGVLRTTFDDLGVPR